MNKPFDVIKMDDVIVLWWYSANGTDGMTNDDDNTTMASIVCGIEMWLHISILVTEADTFHRFFSRARRDRLYQKHSKKTMELHFALNQFKSF